MSELKPCPFCGKLMSVSCMSAAQIDLLDADDIYYDVAASRFAVVCSVNLEGCGATGGYHGTVEGAIEAWNRRAGDE